MTKKSSKLKYTFENIPRKLCPIPFSTLILNPDGRVGCCRERTNDDVVGDIKNSSWQEIWNGPEIRKWRREFLSGGPTRCDEHMKNRLCNLNGYNRLLLPFTEFKEVQTQPPVKLSPDFNGKCNLKCVMCDIWDLENGLYDQLGFWAEAEENLFPYLKFIDPLAGEPFIQKDFYRLIKIMHKKSPDAEWRLTTNGHWKFSPFVEKHLDFISNIFSIQTSIDGATDETYAKIRRGGKLKVVLKNLEQQKEYNVKREKNGLKPFDMLTMMTVLRENWKEIPLMCRLIEGMGINYHFIKCNGPKNKMLVTLELSERLAVLDYLFLNLEARDFVKVYRIIIPLINSISSEKECNKFKKIFFQHTGLWIES